ncbi:methyl-accepting chemotaxis protein [Alteromonadaceae bacterium M269]|nr:methyl-accepting chemotaxis protein [Alteromonadaceae bacterium M269]
MGFLNNWSIGKRILLIPIVGTVGFLINLIVTSQASLSSASHLNDVRSADFPLLQLTQQKLFDLKGINESLGNAATTGEAETLEEAKVKADQFDKDLSTIISFDSTLSAEQRNLKGSFNQWFDIAYGLTSGMLTGDADFSKVGEMNDAYAEIEKQLQDFLQVRQHRFDDAFDMASQNANRNVWTGIIIGIGLAVVLFVVAFPIISQIKGSLNAVSSSLKNIAEDNGDLTVRIQVNNDDEIGELVNWFNSFMEKLQGLMSSLIDTATPLSEAAKEIKGLSEQGQNISGIQENHAQHAKDSADSMQERVSYVASNAAEAATAAQDAQDSVNAGQQVVNQTVKQIEALAGNVDETSEVIAKLERDSNQVGAVLDVIQGIAEQTNLLALNAAIEAARAGEQGRGFAVVADEVRTLASRTADSTSEIQSTIEQLQNASKSAVTAMEAGSSYATESVNLAQKAGESLDEIYTSVIKISQMNGVIAEATGSQREMSSQLAQTGTDMLSTTEQTSTHSQELANVSTRLQSFANALESITRKFKV